MRLEDAQVFLLLGEQLNVRRTAERIGLTQSAVTKVIQRLESEFGLRLVERGASGVVMTDAGRLMLLKAKELAAAFQSLQNEMASMHCALAGTVRIGVVPALLEEKLLPAVSVWRSQHAGMQLQVSVKVSDELIEMVGRGQLELAVCFCLQPGSELRADGLGVQRYHVVVRRGHPLTGAAGPSMAALAEAQWLLPAPSVAMHRWVEDAFTACGLPAPRTAVQTDTSTAQFASLVRNSDLVTVVMTPTFRSAACNGLVELPFEAADPVQPLVLLSRRRAIHSAPVRDLQNLLKRSFHT